MCPSAGVDATLDRAEYAGSLPQTYGSTRSPKSRGAIHPLPSILEAYRTGGGVPYADYGVDLREGQAGINRAMFLYQLASEWLPAIPDIHARLIADPPARIADLGCGAGWSTIGMAQGYPRVSVDGFDLDSASIELADSRQRTQ